VTIRLDATPSGPSMPHLHHPPNFTPDVLPAATLPVYPGLGQAPNMLDCITRGLLDLVTLVIDMFVRVTAVGRRLPVSVIVYFFL